MSDICVFLNLIQEEIIMKQTLNEKSHFISQKTNKWDIDWDWILEESRLVWHYWAHSLCDFNFKLIYKLNAN